YLFSLSLSLSTRLLLFRALWLSFSCLRPSSGPSVWRSRKKTRDGCVCDTHTHTHTPHTPHSPHMTPHTHTHTLTLTHIHTHTHSLTYTHTHTHTHTHVHN